MSEDLSAGDDDTRRDGAELERRTVEVLNEWGYYADRRKSLFVTEADVVAARKEPRGEPADYLVVECKNWATRAVDPPIIFRLVLQAYVGNAMPVLVHTSYLTDRAWKIAQAYDVRLLNFEFSCDHEELPPLTTTRPTWDGKPHRRPHHAGWFRNRIPHMLVRHSMDNDVEAAALSGPDAPCYVTDRTGHGDYE